MSRPQVGAALRQQTPVLAGNLLAAFEERQPTAKYNGSSLAHIVTGYDPVVRVDVDYSGRPVQDPRDPPTRSHP
jgi:hypothetical protein